MKLKKIASLMLAGVMAVSMMTACSGKSADDTEEKPPVVDPVDDTFAASVNDLLSTEQKNVITFTNDATLNGVLAKVAPTIDSWNLMTFNMGAGHVFVTDAQDMRHLLGIDRDNSMVFGKKLFSNEATSVTKAADIFVVDGSYTEEGVAEFVADYVEGLIKCNSMPAVGAKKVPYRYAYTGSIACTKVTNNNNSCSGKVPA